MQLNPRYISIHSHCNIIHVYYLPVKIRVEYSQHMIYWKKKETYIACSAGTATMYPHVYAPSAVYRAKFNEAIYNIVFMVGIFGALAFSECQVKYGPKCVYMFNVHLHECISTACWNYLSDVLRDIATKIFKCMSIKIYLK